jgi:hypothetical protein
MLSTTLKRTAAAVGVVAVGLLASAGPASAQVFPGMVGVTAPHTGPKAPSASSISGKEMTNALLTANRRTNAVTASFSPQASLMETGGEQFYTKTPTNAGAAGTGLDFAEILQQPVVDWTTGKPAGTQIGSEGIMLGEGLVGQMERRA